MHCLLAVVDIVICSIAVAIAIAIAIGNWKLELT
jgi:hypothetical protein